MSFFCLCLAAIVSLGLATPTDHHKIPIHGNPRADNAKTSFTLLYQNNLNASDSINHVGAILLDPMGQREIREACEDIGESLLSRSTLDGHREDFLNLFSYLRYAGRADPVEHYYLADGIVSAGEGHDDFAYLSFPAEDMRLPVLCTQTSNQTVEESQDGALTRPAAKQLLVESDGNLYAGIRDQKSFRFLGIPYADPPRRFAYARLYSKKGQTIRATSYGSRCAQSGGGSEDCLFLNIQTPYLPRAGSTRHLKPVMFWIHGGGFTGGTGADPLTDGGNLASREDIVVVTINYRLSTLGFLAVPGTDVTGNYGIADQILALEWTIKNIAQFGGDPKRITIIGESAGAGSVRVLLGSPPALGKFQGAIAMSNLGGGVALGLDDSYSTTYSSYLTVADSYDRAGQQVFSEANCTHGDLSTKIACLKTIPASTLVVLPTVARYVVQDGHFVSTPELNLIHPDNTTAHVPVIFGNTADDGASFATYPPTPITSHLEGLQTALGISAAHAQRIIASNLFPLPSTGNLTLDSFNVSARIATDLHFRCIDQATVYAGSLSKIFPTAYYYQIERTIAGYDPNHLGGPPNNDPNLPYFRLHGADLPWVFGTLATLRDADDLHSIRLASAYFAAFVRSGQPNPTIEFLRARGYRGTLEAVQEVGDWEAVEAADGPIQLLDWRGEMATLQDSKQCAFLGYPVDYYVNGS